MFAPEPGVRFECTISSNDGHGSKRQQEWPAVTTKENSQVIMQLCSKQDSNVDFYIYWPKLND